MAHIVVSTVIETTPDEVWDVVRVIDDHVNWMVDAETIRFTSDRTSGVGTTFECDTKIGPAKLTDVMEITAWVDGQAMGVAHSGLVTGTGMFTLVPSGPGRTEFRWEEDLTFPFWMGGPFRDRVGGRILEWVWRRNLGRLKAIVESRPGPDEP